MDLSIIGASGYTGVELLRLLAQHPHAKVVGVTSEQSSGTPLTQFFPSLTGFVDPTLTLQAIGKPEKKDVWPALDELLTRSQFFFTALPHGTSTPCVAYLVRKGARVADLSADFRLQDLSVYEKWYGEHEAKELIKDAVYGLPEMHREEMKKTRLVAVPGCYPTGATLGLAPLIKNKLIDLRTVIVDSKSGVSGAGRTLKTSSLFTEVSGGIRAYGVTNHRHTPEIEQNLSRLAGEKVAITFTPHLVPMSRGILTVAYATLAKRLNTQEVLKAFQDYYRKEKFVRVRSAVDPLPDTSHVLGSYFCDVTVRVDERNNRVIAMSAIDNLCRGASGMAVAAMNLMNGWPEETALHHVPLVP